MSDFLDPAEWPRSVEDAVAKLMTMVTEEDRDRIRAMDHSDLINLHFGFGTGIRNNFGLLATNDELMVSACGEIAHPDDASMVIVEAFWQALQSRSAPTRPPPLKAPRPDLSTGSGRG